MQNSKLQAYTYLLRYYLEFYNSGFHHTEDKNVGTGNMRDIFVVLYSIFTHIPTLVIFDLIVYNCNNA